MSARTTPPVTPLVPNGSGLTGPPLAIQATACFPSASSALGEATGSEVAHLMLADRSDTFKLIAFAWATTEDDPPESWRKLPIEGSAKTEPTARAPANPPATRRYQYRIMVSI
jgi:hypothetical protein